MIHRQAMSMLYTAYGLVIESAIDLPELLKSNEARPDVVVRLGKTIPSDSNQKEFPSNRAIAGEACLFHSEIGSITIRAGREILIEPIRGALESDIRLFLLGPVLGILLHQRGYLVLHASCIAMKRDAETVAFAVVGEKGQGKSTLAAAFVAAGHALLSDDIVAVDLSGERPMVVPGFSQLKLWPESLATLGDSVDDLPKARPSIEKRLRKVEQNFPRDPISLSAVFVLADSDTNELQALPPQQAFMQMVQHCYVIHMLRETGESAANFNQTADLVKRVRVAQLNRQRRLDALPDVVRMIERELLATGFHASAK
jgi:hypothetical protein